MTFEAANQRLRKTSNEPNFLESLDRPLVGLVEVMYSGERSVLRKLVLMTIFIAVAESLHYDAYYYYDDTPGSRLYPDESCPTMCTCGLDRVSITVVCKEKNLVRVPVNLSDFTESLLLDGNDFGALNESFLPDVLKYRAPFFSLLSLKSCSITEIGANTFMTRSLRTIDLSDNDIQTIHAGAFSGLTRLRSLNLAGNRLNHISSSTFGSTLSELTALHLGENKLARLTNGTFRGLKRLSELFLQTNLIHEIERGVFDDLPALEILDLSYNKLNESFLVTAFTRSSVTKELHLHENELSAIHATTLKFLPDVENLGLVSNRISDIDDFAFKGMKKIVSLSLSYNGLSEIRENMFDKSARTLQRLDLEGQYSESRSQRTLTRIAPKAFQYLESLRYLVLTGNDLRSFDQALFSNMRKLIQLSCGGNRKLKAFPNVDGCVNLQLIDLHMTSIEAIPEDVCAWAPSLTHVDIVLSAVKAVPNLYECTQLNALNVGHNLLNDQAIGENLRGLRHLLDLELYSNKLQAITNRTFGGLISLEHLNVRNNRLRTIADGAFLALTNLEDLLLDGNELKIITDRTFLGLTNLRYLDIRRNPITEIYPGAYSWLQRLSSVYVILLPTEQPLALGNTSTTSLRSQSADVATIAGSVFAVLFLDVLLCVLFVVCKRRCKTRRLQRSGTVANPNDAAITTTQKETSV